MTLRGHPEFTKAYARDLLGVRRELLGETLYQQGVDSLDEEVHQDRVALLSPTFWPKRQRIPLHSRPC